jgi:AraC-like DNA-binding protein
LSTGVIPEYKRLFRQIIQELQLAKPMYEDVLVALTRQLLALAARNLNRDGHVSGAMQQEMDDAIQYFNKHFAQSISVEEYAKNLHISTAWFIHSFKEHTGMTPMQYILSLRVSNAQTLLETTNYTITEIAAIVGYDNPLYFSRIFKKQLGVSPQQYRSQREKQQDLS